MSVKKKQLNKLLGNQETRQINACHWANVKSLGKGSLKDATYNISKALSQIMSHVNIDSVPVSVHVKQVTPRVGPILTLGT